MIVEIKGVNLDNQGSHLMLLAVLERLRSVTLDLQVVLTAGPNVMPAQVRELRALRKLRLRSRRLDLNAVSYTWPTVVNSLLNRGGRAAEGQVCAVLDASGYAYGGHWTPWLMAYAADEIRRMEAESRPYVFLPQAFGPFTEPVAATAFGAALRRAALICVRDQQSWQHVCEICGGTPPGLVRYPDFTIGVRGDETAATRWGVDRNTVLLVPNSHMTTAASIDPDWRQGYAAFLCKIATTLLGQGRVVMLLNHEGRNDGPICAEVAAASGGLTVIHEDDPRATKGVIGAAGAVVCSRFHACVAALSQGVPCLGTSWSHKYQALFADYGVSDWLVQECNGTAAATRLSALLERRTTHADALLETASRMRAETESMWVRVMDILRAAPASAGVR